MNLDKIIEDFPNTSTPLNKETFTKLAEYIRDETLKNSFPIGKVELFFDDEDHSNWNGFTWQLESKSRFPLGYDPDSKTYNIIGKTGGEEEHLLTINEIPKHQFGIDNFQQGTSDSFLSANKGNGVYVNTFKTNENGGSKAHNNMPPFVVMAFWRRVS